MGPALWSILRPAAVLGVVQVLGILGAGCHPVPPSLGVGGPQISSVTNKARPRQDGTLLAGQVFGDPDEDTLVTA